MKVYTKKLTFHMPEGHIVRDITDDIRRVVGESGVNNGQVTVQAGRSVCAITTLEYEPGCLSDLETALEKFAPRHDFYEHSKRWHDDNGHAHIRSAVMGPSETFVIMDGEICIETWQQIIFCDYCPNDHPRWEVYTSVIGE
ncbi:MAG: YjbQ family protein [Spirochaetales bacterium]|nr:YjbQ family protein [Spirochaetales bacterium]